MRFPLSFGHNVEFLAGSIDVILVENQSLRGCLTYFDNYIIIDGPDKIFAPL